MTEKLAKITILDHREREDGAIDITYVLDEEGKLKMASIGVEFALYCAAAGVDMQVALDNIIKDLKKE